MSAVLRVAGEVRSIEYRTSKNDSPYREISILTEQPDELGDAVRVVIFDSHSHIQVEPRDVVDWVVAVEGSRYGLNARFRSVAGERISVEV